MRLASITVHTILYGSVALARPARNLVSRQTTDSSNCPASGGVHVIAVSGANLAADDYGLLGNLSTSIVNAIPGSTTVQVPYDKSLGNQLAGITGGSANFTQYLDEFHASCPCSKVAIIGYSSGAVVTMNVLCGAVTPWTTPATGLNDSYTDFVIGIIEYGDETHTGSAPYNLGTCTTGDGRFPRSADNAACPIFADRIQSYCDTADPQCCLGTDNNAHFQYDLEYDADSTQYIVKQANKFGDICSSSGTTTSETSTSMTSTSMTSTSETPAPVTSITSDMTSSSTPTPSSSSTEVSPTTTSMPTSTSTTCSCPTITPTPTGACPLTLENNWQYPHMITPISSTSPDVAFGTSYDGIVNSTTSTIFNFDIPSSYSGMTCTTFFNLPLPADLVYSSYTTTGGPGVSFALLATAADASTTYTNAPAVGTSYGDFTVTPGTAFAVVSESCAAGQRLSYEMSATGDYTLEYFQSSTEPVGLYVRAC